MNGEPWVAFPFWKIHKTWFIGLKAMAATTTQLLYLVPVAMTQLSNQIKNKQVINLMLNTLRFWMRAGGLRYEFWKTFKKMVHCSLEGKAASYQQLGYHLTKAIIIIFGLLAHLRT
jgi:hypothetical protein